MTLRRLPVLDALVQELGHKARVAFRRVIVLTAAGAIGAVGCGFAVFAAFSALGQLVGSQLAALGIGAALLTLAALLASFVERPIVDPQQVAALPPKAPTPPADPTTIAVFTAAFVLGRLMADRRRG